METETRDIWKDIFNADKACKDIWWSIFGGGSELLNETLANYDDMPTILNGVSTYFHQLASHLFLVKPWYKM